MIQNPNIISTSYYMTTVDPSSLYNLGYAPGQQLLSIPGSQDEVVILDFADPAYRNSQFGTILLETYEFASTTQIAYAVENFAVGYHDGTGDNDRGDIITILVLQMAVHKNV